mmetsp:Transcript_87971/g.188713  ORF Transcript_87971/g.188713 Transcript_87971/m.188713 type:complete len:248 (-) Transcript_87971:541-1284(-)
MPPDAVLVADEEDVKLDVTLPAILHEERILDVLLHDIDRVRLGKSQAVRRFSADVDRSAPIPVRLLHKPWQVRHLVICRRSGALPCSVIDDIRIRHQAWRYIHDLCLLLQPKSAPKVHADPAEVGLVGEVHQFLPQGAVILIGLLVLEPLLIRVHTPVWTLQEILTEPLSVAAYLAVPAILVPLRCRVPLHSRPRLDILCGHHQGLVVDNLFHRGHLLSAPLNLSLGLHDVLTHDFLVHTPQPSRKP